MPAVIVLGLWSKGSPPRGTGMRKRDGVGGDGSFVNLIFSGHP